ncbi:SWPV1-210 [Shearwaterpox virus]|uniref:SWPV1-210 n=1 Tax=Shearwaterpox virus TaxID=1974596 RepID=A0A1V0S834_CNPV|nr:SWPV1-210 [Shearwaterpox virus]
MYLYCLYYGVISFLFFIIMRTLSSIITIPPCIHSNYEDDYWTDDNYCYRINYIVIDEKKKKYLIFMYTESDDKILSIIQEFEKRNKKCYYLLHYAVIARRLNIVNALLRKGYDASLNLQGYSCLHIVTLPRREFDMEAEIFSKDIYRKVVDYLDSKNNMKLSEAIFIPILKNFLKGNFDLSDEQLKQLDNKAKKEEVSIIKSLLKNEHNLSYLKYNSDIILNAIERQNIDMVKLLLDNDASLISRYIDDYSVLQHSIKFNNVDIFKLVLGKHRDFKRCKYNYISLHYAVMYGSIDILRFLLSLGVNVNTKDIDNYTPLYYSVIYDKYEVTEILLKHGANPNIVKNNSSETVIFKAISSPDTVKLLLDYGAYINDYSNNRMYLLNTIKLILENGTHPLYPYTYRRVEYTKVYASARFIIANIVLSNYKYPNKFNDDIKLIRENTILKEIMVSCEKELEKIQSTPICSRYSLAIFLTCNKNQGCSLLRNPEINYLIENNISDFSIYGSYIKKAINRLMLVENTIKILNDSQSCSYWHVLPIEIKYFIISLIDDDGLYSSNE